MQFNILGYYYKICYDWINLVCIGGQCYGRCYYNWLY